MLKLGKGATEVFGAMNHSKDETYDQDNSILIRNSVPNSYKKKSSMCADGILTTPTLNSSGHNKPVQSFGPFIIKNSHKTKTLDKPPRPPHEPVEINFNGSKILSNLVRDDPISSMISPKSGTN